MTFGKAEIRGARQDEPELKQLPIPDEFLQGVDPAAALLDQWMAAFQHQSIGVRLFIDGIVEDRIIAPSFYDGWKTQQVIDAAITSHEQGRAVVIG